MQTIFARRAAVWLACTGLAACTPTPPPAGGGAPSAEPAAGQTQQPAAGTGREFGITHHATLGGTVVNAAGAPLDSVTVVVQHPVDPQQGSLRQTEAVTGLDGRFTLPAQMFVGGQRDAEPVRVGVVVVAFGFAQRYRGPAGQVPTDSAVAWVTMVPRTQTPSSTPVRLTLRVP